MKPGMDLANKVSLFLGGCMDLSSSFRMKFHGIALFATVLLCSFVCQSTAQDASKPAETVQKAKGPLDSDPKLAGWWRFEEASGGTTADSSAQGRSGVLEGGVTFEACSLPGRVGKAVRFGGSNDCIRIKGYKGITGQSPRTLSVWIKTTAREGTIVAWGADGPGKLWKLEYIRGGLGINPKGGYLYMKSITADDAWHHVAVVVREASPPNLHDDVKLFIDGEPAVIDDIGLLDLWPIDTGDKMDVTIGQRFKGAIDEVRLYERALSEDEIKALFKLGGN